MEEKYRVSIWAENLDHMLAIEADLKNRMGATINFHQTKTFEIFTKLSESEIAAAEKLYRLTRH